MHVYYPLLSLCLVCAASLALSIIILVRVRQLFSSHRGSTFLRGELLSLSG